MTLADELEGVGFTGKEREADWLLPEDRETIARAVAALRAIEGPRCVTVLPDDIKQLRGLCGYLRRRPLSHEGDLTKDREALERVIEWARIAAEGVGE